MTAGTAPPVASVVRVIDADRSPWVDVSRACLEKHTSVPFEVVDTIADGSFGAAANRGAVSARAETLVVMRGDTLVDSGWLEPLLAASARWDAVVTPCVKGFDDAVVASGYVATRNGDLIACAAGRPAGDAFWSFVREVSSPSPACFVVNRRAFLDAGGFDRSAVGSPLEQTAGLAFSLRTRGQRTLFQPASVVRSGCARIDSRPNTPGLPFRRRWQPIMDSMPLVADGDTPRRRLELRDGHASGRLLIIDDRVPHVDRGGGDPRMQRLLLALAASWPALRITLFALAPDNGALYAASLRQEGIEVVYGEALEDWLDARRCFYDVVVISRPRPVLDAVRATQPQARLVYDMEAVHFRRNQRALEVAPRHAIPSLRSEIAQLVPLEVMLMTSADILLCVSEEDRAFARNITPATPSFVVSHASDAPAAVPGFDERQGMLFFGAFWNPGSPNEDAALHLVHRVMPHVWAEDPSIHLVIIGADPTPAVRRLDGGRVTVVGYVANPLEALTRARVHIAPLRIGAGIKLRLLDSMAAGLPFVTTTVGAEGIPLAALAATLVADAPVEIARRALDLHRHRGLWTHAQGVLRGIAAERFSAAAFRSDVENAMSAAGLLPSVASARRSGGSPLRLA